MGGGKASRCRSKYEVPLQVVTIDAVEDVPGGNETALMQAVTMHPVGIGLCVGPWIKEWRAYTGGILTVPGQTPSRTCPTSLHALQLCLNLNTAPVGVACCATDIF